MADEDICRDTMSHQQRIQHFVETSESNMDEVDGPIYEVFERNIVSEVDREPVHTPFIRPKTFSENAPHDEEYPDGPNPRDTSSQDDESLSSFSSSSSSSDNSVKGGSSHIIEGKMLMSFYAVIDLPHAYGHSMPTKPREGFRLCTRGIKNTDNIDDDKVRKKEREKKIQQYEGPHKIKRRSKQLYINGKTRVCEIKTFTYYYKDKKIKEHYITQIEGSTDIKGDTGLRPRDEILSVNGSQLEGMKQKAVIKLLKEIKPGPSGLIDLNLELQRWKDQNNGPVRSTIVAIRLDLHLQPARGSGGSTIRKKTAKENEKELPKGNVINIKFMSSSKACIKVLTTEGLYLLASNIGSVSVGSLGYQGISEYYITPFQGYDDSAMPDVRWVFGYIIHFDINGVTKYMTSCLSNNSTRLIFRSLPDLDENLKNSPDERFFLIHKDGNKTILESMLYRGKCVHFDAASNTLDMQSLNMSNINDETDEEFLLDIVRTESGISQIFRKARESMKCLLPQSFTDR